MKSINAIIILPNPSEGNTEFSIEVGKYVNVLVSNEFVSAPCVYET